MNFIHHKPVDPRQIYAMWQDGWDWLVIAHENPGHVVSVQFHPPSRKLPRSKTVPSPFQHKPARELEPA